MADGSLICFTCVNTLKPAQPSIEAHPDVTGHHGRNQQKLDALRHE